MAERQDCGGTQTRPRCAKLQAGGNARICIFLFISTKPCSAQNNTSQMYDAGSGDHLCPATCHSYTCNDWVAAGYGCDELEGSGCDCSGCDSCSSTYDAGSGDHLCPATCHSYTCNDWVAAGYGCDELEGSGCDCSGCDSCSSTYDAGSGDAGSGDAGSGDAGSSTYSSGPLPPSSPAVNVCSARYGDEYANYCCAEYAKSTLGADDTYGPCGVNSCEDAPDAVVSSIFTTSCSSLLCDGSQFARTEAEAQIFSAMIGYWCPVHCKADCSLICSDKDELLLYSSYFFGHPATCAEAARSDQMRCNPIFMWACSATAGSCLKCPHLMPLPPSQPPATVFPPALPPLPPSSPPPPPASPTAIGDPRFGCGYEGDHQAVAWNTSALVAVVNNTKVTCIKLLADATYGLPSPLKIDRTLAIIAEEGRARLHAIDGGGGRGSILHLMRGAHVALYNLTLSNGVAQGNMTGNTPNGGAIKMDSSSTAHMDSCVLQGNEATGDGGAIYNFFGRLNMVRCLLVQNVAAKGGAISNYGRLAMASCVLLSNHAAAIAGAIYNAEASASLKTGEIIRGRLDMDDCVLESNYAFHDGGAIFNLGALYMRSSVMKNNMASGNGWAIYQAGLKATSASGRQEDTRIVALLMNNITSVIVGNLILLDFHKAIWLPSPTQEELGKLSQRSDAILIYTGGVDTDFGSCAPGTNPGEVGKAVTVADGNFTGCPFLCPKGNYGPGGSTEDLRGFASACAVGCETCPSGAVCPSEGLAAAELCDPGHYNPDTGSQDASSCRSCETGKYQGEEGATACVACAAGTYAASQGSTACQECQAGGYCEEVGADSASAFVPCEPGTWSDVVGLNTSTGCIACGEGKYQPINGATSADACLDCSLGTANALSGASACDSCIAGKYQSEAGMTACDECPVASYCPSSGLSSATACPGGTWSNSTGLWSSSQCIDVVSNEYASTGSQFPETCPKSGFMCPGKAHDDVNAVPGSKPIAVASGQAKSSVNVTRNASQLSFSLTLEADSVDTERVAQRLADFYGVASTAIELSVAAGSVVLTVAITGSLLDLATVWLLVNNTDADVISKTLGINASKPTTLQVSTVSEVTSVESTSSCPMGYWCSAGISIPCSAGTFNDKLDMISMGACTACPYESTSPEASTSIAECICNEHYYDELSDSPNIRCVACPVGSNCSKGLRAITLADLPLRKGYWRTGPTSVNLLRCPDSSSNDTACIGGSAVELCKPWTTGAYCTLCNVTDGSRYYDSATSSCLACSGDVVASTVAVVLGVLAAVAAALVLLALRPRLRKWFGRLFFFLKNVYLSFNLRSKIKQLFTLYQIVTKLETVFRVPMPMAVQQLLDKLSFVSLNIASLGLPMGCIQLGTFQQELAFSVFAPLVLIGAISSGCTLAALRPAKRNGFTAAEVVKQGLMRALPSCLFVSFLAFPMVSSLAFEAFSCEDFDDGTSHLIADYSVDCNDDTQYGPIFNLAWVGIFLYPVAVPLSYALLLRKARTAILSGRPSTLSRALNFLHRDVEPRCYWWEIAEIVKKLVMVGFIILVQRGQTIQLVIGFAFCLVYLLFSNVMAPFTYDDDDFFSVLSNFVLTATVFLCVVLKQATLAEAVGPFLSDDMYTTYSFDSALVTGILIAIITAAVLVAIGFAVQQFIAAASTPIFRLQSTRKAPELSLGEGQKWHLFLSHIWSTGQDANATIKRQLCLLLPGVSIFLDVDDLEDIGALEDYIRASQLIQLFCSKGYFKSRNCLREVHATLEQRKRVTLMVDPEKGGAPLEVIKNEECPHELRGSVFDNRVTVLWYRIADFQKVSLKQVGEQILLSCPTYKGKTALPLFIPGELTTIRWGFTPAVRLYCSQNNPGAQAAMHSIRYELAMALRHERRTKTSQGAKEDEESEFEAAVGLQIGATQPVALVTKAATQPIALVTKALGGADETHFILYLSKETWLGTAGDALAEEVRTARAAGVPITMVHSTPDNADGCEFGLFFSTTPGDLIQDGLYSALAFALYPPPFRHVSACLVARALGATKLSKGKRMSSHKDTALLKRAMTGKDLAKDATPVVEAMVEAVAKDESAQSGVGKV